MPPRSSLRRIVACAAVLALSLPSVASSQDDQVTEQARLLYGQGRAALRAGKPDPARLALERAYQLRPTPQIAFALGLAELEMGLFVQAASHMALYIHQFPDATKDERKAFAEAERNVAQLVFDVNVDRTNIFVDGEDFGHTPFVFQPVYVLAGRRVIRASCPGFKPVTQTYDVVAGRRTDVRILLEREEERPAPPPAPSAQVAPAPSGSSARAGLLPHTAAPDWWQEPRTLVVGGGVVLTLAAVALAAVEGARASSARSDADALAGTLGPHACQAGASQGNADCARLGELEGQHQAAADLGRGALIGAAVLGAGTTAAWFLWPHSKVHVAPQVGTSAAGILISGVLQ